MSDSVTKWHEMQEDKKTQSATGAGTFIYESPDGGKTVTARPFGGDIKDRVVIQHPQKETYQLKQLQSVNKILEDKGGIYLVNIEKFPHYNGLKKVR